MPRVEHFEIPADEPEKLRDFYEKVFRWDFKKWEDSKGKMDYWFIYTGNREPGINGGMLRRKAPEEQVVNTIGVLDIDKYVERIEENGGEIIEPKTAINGVGWNATFIDPQGNKYGLIQEDRDAK